MTQVTKHYCDWKGCKNERAGNRDLQVFSHSEFDASGDESNRWDAHFDLCVIHLYEYVESLIESAEGFAKKGGVVKSRTPFEVVKFLGIHFELR